MPLQGDDEFDIPFGDGEDIPTLGVPGVTQDGDELCWSACAQMVRAFYGVALDQCEIVSIHYGVDCCGPPPPPLLPAPGWDVPLPSAEVDVVYAKLGLRAQSLPKVDFDDLVAEIAAGRPVQVGLQREDGTAHLVVVIGAGLRDGREWVKLNDPLGNERGLLTYDDLLARGAVESWIGIEV